MVEELTGHSDDLIPDEGLTEDLGNLDRNGGSDWAPAS